MGMPISTASWEMLSISEVKELVLSGLHKMVELVFGALLRFGQMNERKKMFMAVAKTGIEIFLIILFIIFIRIPGIDTRIRICCSPPIRR